VYPHAHYIAKDIQGYATLPDGSQQWLIRISDWDFNWQDDYEYAEPIFLPAGTTISMRFRYDNSSDNVLNPNDPPKRVVHGPESTDEMGSLLVQVIPKNPDDLRALREAMDRHRVETFPDHWAAHNNLGNRARERGDYEEALTHYHRALEAKSDFGPAHYNMAMTYQVMNRLDEAAEHYRAAQRLMPGFAPPHHNLGWTLMERGDWAAAIAQFESALQIDPRLASAHEGLAAALTRLGRHAEAIEHLRRALELDPDDLSAHVEPSSARCSA
jgi:tetratricopeptide (TPR) repeat protein